MGSKVVPEDMSTDDNVILSWKYPDGSVATGGHPLPRAQAEHLSRIYGGMYPDQTFWLEPVKMDETRGLLRVRRRRPQASPRNTK
jgi:hypothetical protein